MFRPIASPPDVLSPGGTMGRMLGASARKPGEHLPSLASASCRFSLV